MNSVLPAITYKLIVVKLILTLLLDSVKIILIRPRVLNANKVIIFKQQPLVFLSLLSKTVLPMMALDMALIVMLVIQDTIFIIMPVS